MPRRIFALAITVAACARTAPTPAPSSTPSVIPAIPAPAPSRWLGLLGEYDTPAGMRIVLEDGGRLVIADTNRHSVALAERGIVQFGADSAQLASLAGVGARDLTFLVNAADRAVAITVGGTRLLRREIEPQAGTNQLRVTPVRPVEEIRREALAASPPKESGTFRQADLVELTKLDPSIKLEIRYASTNNFLGVRFYDAGRAFMQRPAAEALVRAHRSLLPMGYGLLIHDAYRPWYVTKMFWDATPVDKHWLVADPSQGSRHNRGSAVDLTLYDVVTGKPVEMPGTYDESTDRSFADYPGGTSRQRWHRALLRRAMEAQGFTVNPNEWWHFDYKDWRQYPIGNITFDKIGR